MPLKDWQVPMADAQAKALAERRFFVNACVTGSGKTYVCCDVITRRKRPTVIVAPKAALTQWRRVADQMGASPYVVDVINPEQVSKPSGCQWYTRDGLWRLPASADVVFDEIHRSCGGVKSVTGLAVAQLKAFGASLCAMSATVACDPLHLRALGYWAGFHGFSKPSFYSWCRAHGCRDVDIGYGKGSAGRTAFEFTRDRKDGAAIMAAIRKDFGDSMLALGPDDIPGFPSQTVGVRRIDLSARDRREIDAAYEAMSERMKSAGKSQMAESMRDRQRVEFVMAAALAELAAGAADDGYSAVVVFNFTEPRERFVEALAARGILNVSQVYGCDSHGREQRGRQESVDLFQADVNHVIAVNCEAGGVALSLHGTAGMRMRKSFLIPSFNAAAVRQALGRIRRVDGTHADQSICVAAGTIMERVASAMERKLGNLDALLDADLVP